MNDIAERLERTFAVCAGQPALCVGGRTHTFGQLRDRVVAIHALLESVAGPDEPLIGIIADSTLDTYASILGILRSGRAFVPLNPQHPAERNASIARQASLRTVLQPSIAVGLEAASSEMRLVETSAAAGGQAPPVAVVAGDALAYLLFTSGSTGEPKGVPITRENLNAFLDALDAAGCGMHTGDRVLQMFDLTFDFSIASTLAPLSSGACIFPLGDETLKFAEVYRVLDEERITVAPMVPSVLGYLRPYFEDVHLPALRLCFFCGEALHADVVDEWMRCAPDSAIVNFYGPTEATVFAMYYTWQPAVGHTKALNGIVSIGRAMDRMQTLLVDDDLEPVALGDKGELCLAGAQLTPGYWNDPARNARAFFCRELDGASTRFYRTGDLAAQDADGDLFFVGRVDHQVKLHGYRVELGEIEHHARELVPGHTCIVVPRTNSRGDVELHLVVERYTDDLKPVLSRLRERVPSYMVPTRAVAIAAMPLSANGKIDRQAVLRELETVGG